MDKKEILKEFSADPDRYYNVKLFQEQGFVRKSCAKCSRFFWTLNADRTLCPDDGLDTYSFIGEPPTTKRFDYTQAWKQVEEFFVKNNHTSVSRYPVVCRWRDDLYFTIASVVDFQRVMGSKVVFEFPANPLVVPQTCLRFKDLENVGVTGRHFSSFCMIGQHSVPDLGGYWKDECVDLDFRLLTDQFGIKKEEVVFVEDVWAGGGSFGPSLEYFVRGLELGNAVFTEFQGELGQHTTLDQRVIDMGAGLERFAWITMGTPTAYDCCFGPINEKLFNTIGIDSDSEILKKYFTEIAKEIDHFDDLNEVRRLAVKNAGITDDQLNKMITPLEGIYLIADHLRTLIFAITDGALPSNVGGGYNLRMMLRRINATISKLNLKLDIDDLIDTHIDYLKDTYPELDEKREDVKTILKIESARYEDSKVHMKKKAEKIREKGVPSVDELITLYESDGITPEYLKEVDAISEVPSQFYSKLSDLHQSNSDSYDKKKIIEQQLGEIPETEMLFYKDDPMEFEAKVIKVIDNQVVLDRTSFYARGGGQEPDFGTIAGFNVIDVNKHGSTIIHQLEGETPKEGDTVTCKVDKTRRSNITKNHTSTHIINASSRGVLGSWVWQHSAFKDDDHARLDITHHSSLTSEQVQQIEDAANQMVKENHPVSIDYYDRGTAEQKYGFRIYQGGVVPVKSVRIVSIEDKDIEACGGTHVKKTGDIELIKITKTKRIQDGVVRIEFVSGPTAYNYVKQQEEDSKKQDGEAKQKEQLEKEREETKQNWQKEIPKLIENANALREWRNNVVHNYSSIPFDPKKIMEQYKGAFESLRNIPIALEQYKHAFESLRNIPIALEQYKNNIESFTNQIEGIRNISKIIGEIKKAPKEEQEGMFWAILMLNKFKQVDQEKSIEIEDIVRESIENEGFYYYTISNDFDEYFHMNFGKKLVKNEPNSIYSGVFEQNGKVRIIVFAGQNIVPEKGADKIAKEVSSMLGGAGGGNSEFAQGGGTDTSKKDEAIAKAKSMILG